MIESVDNITVEQAKIIIESVELLLESVGAFFSENSNQPAPESRVIAERQGFSDAKFVDTAYAQAGTLMEVAADHLSALTRVLQEPVHTVAPWNCLRAVLESSAVAAWILDLSLDAKSRVSRSFAFRYEGLVQQLRFARAAKLIKDIETVQNRITEVESKVRALGYEVVKDKKKKKVIGFAERMPCITDLVRDVLDEEANYRLLSAITHAHPWALQQLSFQVFHQDDRVFLEKDVKMISIVYLCTKGILAYLQPVKNQTQLCGWDKDRYNEIVKQSFEPLSTITEVSE